MDAQVFISPLIATLITLAIVWIRDPGGWKVEQRIKRAQQWKELLDLSTRIELDPAIHEELKARSHRELLAIRSELQEIEDKYCRGLSVFIAISICLWIDMALAAWTLNIIRSNSILSPPPKELVKEFYYSSACTQSSQSPHLGLASALDSCSIVDLFEPRGKV